MKKIARIISLCLAALILVSSLFGLNISAITVNTVDNQFFILGDVLYSTDFENETVGSMPSGWEIANTSFGYNGGGKSEGSVTQLGSAGKVFTYSSTGIDTWVSMPEIKTRNYVFEATFLTAATTSSGSFGIANGMYGGLKEAGGAVFTSIPVKNAAGGDGYYRSKGTPSVQKVDFKSPIKTPPGTTVKMKFVSFNGINYYYINDYYMGAFAQGDSKSASDWAGFYTYNGTFHVTNVTVTEIADTKVKTDTVNLNTDGNNVQLVANLSFDKDSTLYKNNVSGEYEYSENAPFKIGVLTAVSDSSAITEIKAGDAGVVSTVFTSNTSDYAKLYFEHSINIEKSNLDKFYIIRPFILVEDNYFYSTAVSYCPAKIANLIYASSDDETKSKLQSAFKDSNVFKGTSANSITFTLFSDFHYEQDMYIGSIEDLRTILKRADTSGSSFIMSAGDFCNNFAGSPELTNTYLNYKKEDGTILTAYNIYGNHELESEGNSMANVTPTLTNNKNVVWGTADGSFDSNIGYYYFEESGFRIVCIDTNYSKNSSGVWEHNKANSYGPPSGNTASNSLGDVQLAWFENVLTDAANKGIPCIVVGHAGFSGKFATSSYDAEAVRAIYARVNAIKAGTVVMSINGHEHTNNQGYVDGVFYFDTNTVFNGRWVETGGSSYHYSGYTYRYENYDDNGNLIEVYDKPITSLYQGRNTWFFEEPLSAVITVDEFGTVKVDGMETTWKYNIVPTNLPAGEMPSITSGTFWDCYSLGHIWSDEWEHNDSHHWHICENLACTASNITENSGYAKHNFTEVEDDKYLVEGATDVYYKSCICGAVSDKTFGDGVMPPEIDVWDGSIASSYAGGNGTADNPYLIETPEQLARMIGYDVLTNYTNNTSNGSTNKHYKLMNDIYLNNIYIDEWYNGSKLNNWYSATSSRFCGSLDGNGYTVYGLHFASDATNAALIPVIDAYHGERYIKNLTISDSYIKGSSMSAAVVTRMYGGTTKALTIENCYVTDSVIIAATQGYIGGLLAFSSVNTTPTYINIKNTACLATKPDGSCLQYGAVGIKLDFYAEFYLTVNNSFIYANSWYGITNKGSVTDSCLINNLSNIKGDAAKNTLSAVNGFAFTEGYPVNIKISQLMGDVTGDGIGDAFDLVALRRYLVYGEKAVICDMNADDACNVKDLVNLKKKLAERMF